MELKIRAEKTSEKRLRKQGWECWGKNVENNNKMFEKDIMGNHVLLEMFDNKTIVYVDDVDGGYQNYTS